MGSLLEVALKEAREFHNRNGTSLTLRGLFYILVSKGVIPNTRNAYKRLSEVLAKARYSGKFPWYLIKDTSRRYFYCERSTYYPSRALTPEELKRVLESYVNSYTDVSVNPWDDQPYRVVVAVEKEALGELVYRFVREVWPHGVYQVRVLKGYESATNVHELAEAIESMPEDKTPVVLHLGDYDPSGEDIARDYRERLEMLTRRRGIVFEKVAVTLDQIVELQLPAKPESVEEVEKMRRDPRYKSYIARIKEVASKDPRIARLVELYGSHEIRVELDALASLHPDKFKEILRRAIERYFDVETYERVTKPREEELRRRAEELRRQTMENLSKLLGTSPGLGGGAR